MKEVIVSPHRVVEGLVDIVLSQSMSVERGHSLSHGQPLPSLTSLT